MSVLAPLLAAGMTFVGQAGATSAGSPGTVAGDWYLAADHVAEARAQLVAPLWPVRVAVLDSGIDGGNPALAASVVAAHSFVSGDPLVDSSGHGTFVAGEIVAVAAATAPGGEPVQLLVGKVTDGGSIDPRLESRAIYWAVANGARVINLSFGGLRDPRSSSIDTYSTVEAAAVRYAVAHWVVVVAAAGNGDDAPSVPWPYADWPAALPHVIGVSALAPDGSVPDWSNRDPRFDELAAPGVGIVSTFPRDLTSLNASCPDQGYSDCGPPAYQSAEGTSFAAPQVAAAAAVLLSVEPGLSPDQVSWILERSADDATPATGCGPCGYGRDSLTGWGSLNIARALAALKAQIPPANRYEPTNDAGEQAHPLRASHGAIAGDLDYWENPVDVYRVHLRPRQQLWARLSAQSGGTTLALWTPGTEHVSVATKRPLRQRVLAISSALPDKRLHLRARRAGWYYLEVALRAHTNSIYTLAFAEAR